MGYECKEIAMSDGNVNFFHCWTPDIDSDSVKAVVLLSHGMVEHAFRYDHFARYLNERGYAFYGEDHRGHGKTAEAAEKGGTGKFGYLADKDGFFRVVCDIKEEAELLRKQYPGKKLFLFAHSFGSLVGQCFMEKYGGLVDGVVLCGTAGPRTVSVHFGRVLAGIVKGIVGARNVSKFIAKLTFSGYGDDWISRDKEMAKKYADDPWCTFTCTSGFYSDLMTGLCYIHRKANMKAIPTDLPVLLIAGTKDPVGSYGKTVAKLSSIYKANGMSDVEMRLYEDARHELINETNREEVMEFVASWFDKRGS